jgi:starch synthase (maltosyl-transferring)
VPAQRIVIQYPAPAIDDGRFPAKRCVGDRVGVFADIFRDGHDVLRAAVRYRGPRGRKLAAGQHERLQSEMSEGVVLLEAARSR